MDYSERLNKLFFELFENSKSIGVMEDYVDQVSSGELPDIPTDLTRSAPQLYSRHYQLVWMIEDLIREDTINKERSKSRFKRLFNR